MEQTRSSRAWTLAAVAVLALTVGVMARRSVDVPKLADEELHDAVAAPMAPVVMGAVRVVQPNTSYFASPSGRRAEAEAALMSSRAPKSAKATAARAARLRRRAAADAVTVR